MECWNLFLYEIVYEKDTQIYKSSGLERENLCIVKITLQFLEKITENRRNYVRFVSCWRKMCYRPKIRTLTEISGEGKLYHPHLKQQDQLLQKSSTADLDRFRHYFVSNFCCFFNSEYLFSA